MSDMKLQVELLLANKQWEKNLQKSSRQIGSFGKSVKTIAGGIKTAFATAGLALSLDFIGSLIKGAEEARRADQRLDQVAKTIDLFGKNLPSVTARLKKFADQQEISTGYTAEEIKAAQTKILTYSNIAKTAGKLGGVFDRTTMAAINLAATGYGSVESNAESLARALSNPVKALATLERQGFKYSKRQKEMFKLWVSQGKIAKAQKYILADVESQVNGVAEASGSSLQKISNAFGQMGDAVGEQFLPVIDRMVQWFQGPDGQKAIADFTDKVKKLGDWFMSPDGQKAMESWIEDLKVLISLAGDFLGLVSDVANLLKEKPSQSGAAAISGVKTAYGSNYKTTADVINKGTGPMMSTVGNQPQPINLTINGQFIDSGKFIVKSLKQEAARRGTTVGKMVF